MARLETYLGPGRIVHSRFLNGLDVEAAKAEVNRRAEARLRGPKRLVVLPGAGHLFEEPGALPAVAGLAASWYVHYLSDVSAAESRRRAG